MVGYVIASLVTVTQFFFVIFFRFVLQNIQVGKIIDIISIVIIQIIRIKPHQKDDRVKETLEKMEKTKRVFEREKKRQQEIERQSTRRQEF